MLYNYKPVVHLNPTTNLYKIIQGKQLVLTCVVEAQPPVPSTGFTWRKNGDSITGQTSNRLTITDAGSYTCTATNTINSTTTSPIVIDVLYPPVVATPSVFKIIESTSLSMPCTATGNPSNINYRWTGPNGFNIGTNVLTISNINTSQSGQYICSAFNTMIPTNGIQKTGEGNSTTTIDVLSRPHPPCQIKIQSQANNQICVEWKLGFNGGTTQTFIVQHSTDNNTWVDSSPIPDRNDDQFIQYCITDLEPETKYYIRMAIKNRFDENQVVYLFNIVKTTGEKGEKKEYSRGRASGIGIGIGISAGVVLLALVSFVIYRRSRRGKQKGVTAAENYSTLNRDIVSGEPMTYQELNDVRTYVNLGTDSNTGIHM